MGICRVTQACAGQMIADLIRCFYIGDTGEKKPSHYSNVMVEINEETHDSIGNLMEKTRV